MRTLYDRNVQQYRYRPDQHIFLECKDNLHSWFSFLNSSNTLLMLSLLNIYLEISKNLYSLFEDPFNFVKLSLFFDQFCLNSPIKPFKNLEILRVRVVMFNFLAWFLNTLHFLQKTLSFENLEHTFLASLATYNDWVQEIFQLPFWVTFCLGARSRTS